MNKFISWQVFKDGKTVIRYHYDNFRTVKGKSFYPNTKDALRNLKENGDPIYSKGMKKVDPDMMPFIVNNKIPIKKEKKNTALFGKILKISYTSSTFSLYYFRQNNGKMFMLISHDPVIKKYKDVQWMITGKFKKDKKYGQQFHVKQMIDCGIKNKESADIKIQNNLVLGAIKAGL